MKKWKLSDVLSAAFKSKNFFCPRYEAYFFVSCRYKYKCLAKKIVLKIDLGNRPLKYMFFATG